jgi:hypothetical protein
MKIVAQLHLERVAELECSLQEKKVRNEIQLSIKAGK